MGQRQALTTAVAAERADERSGDARADIGADRRRQRLAEIQLAGSQSGQRQHQCGMAGLQHHRGKQADRDEHQLPGQTASVVLRQVHATEAGETGLDLIDAEKDEGDAEHDTPGRLALVAGEAGQHPENQQRQGQRTQADVLPGQCQQPDTRGGAEIGAEQNGDTAGKLDQPGADESDGEQRDQRAGLQQHGAAHAEHQALERRRRTARQQLFELATGQLAQPLFEALHAEQEQGESRAQLEPSVTGPERPGQHQQAHDGQKCLEEAAVQGGGFAARDGRRSLLQQHRDRKAQALASRDADDVDQRWAL